MTLRKDPPDRSEPWSRQEIREGVFPQTQWSLVLRAQSEDETTARAALSELCQRYWKPLYVFVRSSGYDAERSKDLTQGFFEKLLRIESLGNVNREKGSLRAYLLTSMRYFLASQTEKRHAARRGGGRDFTMDFQDLERGLAPDALVDYDTPEKLFEQRWAVTLLDNVLEKLEAAYARKGDARVYEELNEFLSWHSGEQTYAQAAAKLAMSEGSVKVRVYRMRKHFRELLRREIADTVSSYEEVDAEITHLFGVFA